MPRPSRPRGVPRTRWSCRANEIAYRALPDMSKIFLSIVVTALVVLVGIFYIALLRL
jgi:hypothetical protein